MTATKKSKFAAILLTAAILCGLGLSCAIAEEPTWTLSGNTLTVSGSGATGLAPEAIDKTAVLSIELGADINEVSPYAFANFSALETVSVNGSIATIGAGAFSGCSNLKQYEFKSGLVSIRDYAFANCRNLFVAEKTLPDSIRHIGLSAFHRCQTLDLERLPTPGSGLALGTGAFAYTGMESLREIQSVYTLSNVMDESRGYAETAKEGIPPKCFYGSGLTEITISNKTVGQEAFSFCKNLKTVNMEQAETLGWRAFANSENLVLKQMPQNLCYLGGGVFYADKNVRADKMPSTMKSDWMADNFLGAGWYITVETYVQNIERTDYDLFGTALIPSHALWMATMDTSGDTPIVTTTCEGGNAALEGTEIDDVYIGPDETFQGKVLGEVPDIYDYKLRHDEPYSQRVDTSVEPCVLKIYYDLVDSVMSVTVPTALNIYVNGEGVTTTADDAKITNYSNKPIQVIDLDIQGMNDWMPQDDTTFDPAGAYVNEKKFSMNVNGESTRSATAENPTTVTFNQENWPKIARHEDDHGIEFPIAYTAKVAPQSSSTDEQIATIIFSITMAP